MITGHCTSAARSTCATIRRITGLAPSTKSNAPDGDIFSPAAARAAGWLAFIMDADQKWPPLPGPGVASAKGPADSLPCPRELRFVLSSCSYVLRLWPATPDAGLTLLLNIQSSIIVRI